MKFIWFWFEYRMRFVYMPEPIQLYISLWAVIIWFATAVLEISLKNKNIVCSTSRITEIFEYWIFNFYHQAVHLKLHQTWQHLWFTYEDQFYVLKKSITYKGSIFSLLSTRWPWQSTSYNTDTGRFFMKQICSIVEF